MKSILYFWTRITGILTFQGFLGNTIAKRKPEGSAKAQVKMEFIADSIKIVSQTTIQPD